MLRGQSGCVCQGYSRDSVTRLFSGLNRRRVQNMTNVCRVSEVSGINPVSSTSTSAQVTFLAFWGSYFGLRGELSCTMWDVLASFTQYMLATPPFHLLASEMFLNTGTWVGTTAEVPENHLPIFGRWLPSHWDISESLSSDVWGWALQVLMESGAECAPPEFMEKDFLEH